MDLKFTWGGDKNAINIKKHGISFEDAAIIFSDPNHLEIYDGRHSTSEIRWKKIGLSGCEVLSVIFTEKDDIVRIISARKADKKEEKEYFDGYS